jgi:16S rRNA (cytidine1402-2'-O)-methyltransferase
MDIHGIALGQRPLVPYHDHNGAAARPRLMAALREGRSVAYCSEAGTPLIADPGFQLGVEARAEGLTVRAAPGASALLTALCVGGLPTDRFTFAGFLPPKQGARRKALEELAAAPGTLVLYESPRRLGAMLADASDVLGDRRAVVCRELTKRFEEVVDGSLEALARRYEAEPPKGEIVVLIDRGTRAGASEEEIEALLRQAMEQMSLKSSVKDVSERTGVSRSVVYELALKMKDGQ